MKLTLPLSQLITPENINQVPGIEVYLENNHTLFEPCYYNKELIRHDSRPILDIYNVGELATNKDYLSCHLGMSSRGAKVRDYYYVSDEVWAEEKIRQEIKKKVDQFKNFGIKNISLENTNYYSYSAYEYVCEPEFIREVIEENDVGFCFDIAHAQISTMNLNRYNISDVNVNKYANSLPLDRITEIHLSGYGFVNGRARDLHEVPTDEQLDVLDWLDREYNLKDVHVVVEYYRCFDTLCEIYEMLHKRYNK